MHPKEEEPRGATHLGGFTCSPFGLIEKDTHGEGGVTPLGSIWASLVVGYPLPLTPGGTACRATLILRPIVHHEKPPLNIRRTPKQEEGRLGEDPRG